MTTAIAVSRKSVHSTHLATLAEAKARQVWLRKQDRTWLKIGKMVKLGIDQKDYAALGYPNARKWMLDTIPNSLTWIYQAMKAEKILRGVPEEKLEQLPRDRVVELLRLPERERRTPAKAEAWVDKALAAPSKSEVRKEVNVARGTPDEPILPFHLVLPESVHEEMMRAEVKIAGILALDIEADRKLRIVVWARIATLINTTEEQELIVAMKGV